MAYSDTKLSCGIYHCLSCCRQLFDHSQMPCNQVSQELCSQGHKISWRCSEGRPRLCNKCERESAVRERKSQRDHELEVKRQGRQKEYARQVADLDGQIDRQRQTRRDITYAQEQERTIEQKRRDFAAAVSSMDCMPAPPSDADARNTKTSSPS